MFSESNITPGQLLEIMWKIACRTPSRLIPLIIFGKPKSEVYARVRYFRDVAGWFEDRNIILMGGPGKMVEGDGMFVVGKRKCGVGRYHSKEHIYVCLERNSKKIRRIVVRDKSADVLSVFAKHLKPNTEMCCDPGTENTYFDDLPAVVTLHKIPGPIHIDPEDPRKNTQAVERSHSTVKMRLRSGRGVYRHNLQPIMDLEDFIHNRTIGTPSSIFKALGDTARAYSSTIDNTTVRMSNIPLLLANDRFESIAGLTLTKIQTLCTPGIFRKSERYKVRKSDLISTQVFSVRNIIEGEFRAAYIHDQLITWGRPNSNNSSCEFNLETIKATCSCRYYKKVTMEKLPHEIKYCTHIIGQLRRVIFLS